MRRIAPVAALALLAGALPLSGARAQEGGVRAPLEAHGLPADLVDGVAAVADQARAQGLPTAPLVDKALEGWAKHVPGPRIVGVLREYVSRLGEAGEVVRGAGLADPPGDAVSAVAEARLRGMTREQVVAVVRAGRGPATVAPGLKVAAALASQGLALEQSVQVVARAIQQGRTVDQLLDLPATMRAFQADGMAMPEIGRRLLQGEGLGAMRGIGAEGGGAGGGARVPPPPPAGTRAPGPKPTGGGRGPG
jgi:hypothetical protein